MKITNKKTGVDVSGLFLQLMKGEITNRKFEYLSGLKEKNMSEVAVSQERKLTVKSL